jgi:hypothetical protein
VEYRDIDFVQREVPLDGNTFTGCTFRNCLLIYSGGDVDMSANRLKQNIKWRFEGPASATFKLLSAIYNDSREGGKELVEEFFELIRRGQV